MKISQKQAALLAREVLNTLKKQKVGEVPETVVNQLKKFKEKRQLLFDACKVSDEALREHESSLRKIVGTNGNDRINSYDSVTQMVDKLKERDFPRVSQIEDEIILGAMFSNEDDLQSFINKIVKKFDKKTKSRVLQN